MKKFSSLKVLGYSTDVLGDDQYKYLDLLKN